MEKGKFNDKVYLMSIIELLINGKNKTDLGTHVLEYKMDVIYRNTEDISFEDYINQFGGKVALALLVKLKNKETNQIDWGNIYYKKLDDELLSNQIFEMYKSNQFEEIIELLNNSSLHQKIDFIDKKETTITKKSYAQDHMSTETHLANFFENLQFEHCDDAWPCVKLNGKIPKNISTSFEFIYKDIINNYKNQVESINFQKIKK